LAVGTIIFTGYDLISSIGASEPILVYLFMAMIIMGFLAAEIIYMDREEEEE